MAFLHTYETQVVGIPHRVRQGPAYSTSSISWLLMSWRRKEPGHQQPRYWPSYTDLTRARTLKVNAVNQACGFSLLLLQNTCRIWYPVTQGVTDLITLRQENFPLHALNPELVMILIMPKRRFCVDARNILHVVSGPLLWTFMYETNSSFVSLQNLYKKFSNAMDWYWSVVSHTG